MKIESGPARPSDGIGYIEDAGLCLESHAETRAQVGGIETETCYVVLRPSCIEKGEKKRVQANEITVFDSADRILRGENALFVKTPQQPVAADHEQFVAIGIGAVVEAARGRQLQRGSPCQSDIMCGGHLHHELIGMFLYGIV